MDSHKGINTGGRRLRASTCHSGKNFGLEDTWCMNPRVLSHCLEAPAVMEESKFRSSGRDTMSLGSVSGRDGMSLGSVSGCDAMSLGSVSGCDAMSLGSVSRFL